MTLDSGQVASERAGVVHGNSQAAGMNQRGDHERRFGWPSPVDRGPADASSGSHSLDGEGTVSSVLQDLACRVEDRLVAADVARPSGASAWTVCGDGFAAGHTAPLSVRNTLQPLA